MHRLSGIMLLMLIIGMGAIALEPSPSSADAQVAVADASFSTNSIYLQYLGRNATPADLQRLPATLSEDQVRVRVLGSNEFYDQAGATDRGFIVQLHHSVIGRAPLQAEYIRVSERLAQSTTTELRSRRAVAATLLAGSDYRTLGTSAFPNWPDQVFQDQRVIAYYGHHRTAALGVLGETGPREAIARVQAAAAPFSEPGTPAIGAFEMIVTVAQGSAGADGDFSQPSDIAELEEWIDLAEQHGVYVILDIQPGRSDFLTESVRYESLLMRPHVGLALDPEWRMGPTQVPGEVIGRVTAAEVNQVSAWLANLVNENDLPEKIFIIHQFQERMIVNREQVIDRPGLAMTIHADGFGDRAGKAATYSRLHVDAPLYNGFKLFIDEDTNIFQPSDVLSFTDNPIPDFISYQ